MMWVTEGKRVTFTLQPQDLATFPCDALCAIDDLWVEHSQGRFGLSVQAQIWHACGSPDRYLSEAWEMFGTCVGWRDQETATAQQTEDSLATNSPEAGFDWNQAILDLGLGWL